MRLDKIEFLSSLVNVIPLSNNKSDYNIIVLVLSFFNQNKTLLKLTVLGPKEESGSKKRVFVFLIREHII